MESGVSFETNYQIGSVIKSIQRGTITLPNGSATGVKTATATINAVVTSKSLVLPTGAYTSFSPASGGNSSALLDLTNSTTVTATYHSFTSSAESVAVGYVVIEFY